MPYFSEVYVEFFKELAANNSKEWMNDNRKRYEKDVRDPFREFVQDLIFRLREHDPELELDPKDAIFRINNDIRFNPDKPLYKNYFAAVISKYGRKDMEYPGFYFQLGPEMIVIAGGSYMIGKKHLEKVRHAIARDPDVFYEIINHKPFKKAFGELQGEENKRLPADLKDAAEAHPIIYKKQFYYWVEEDASHITSEMLPEMLARYYLAGKPLSDWLAGYYPAA